MLLHWSKANNLLQIKGLEIVSKKLFPAHSSQMTPSRLPPQTGNQFATLYIRTPLVGTLFALCTSSLSEFKYMFPFLNPFQGSLL